MASRGKYLVYIVALLTVALIAGCGGASAPPVELPAPVTGQIDISGPSATGKATITGNAGAVTGGSTVLAINDSQVETSLWQVTDFLFPKAYAQVLPPVCELVGRACAVAAADGSFTMEVDAIVGDQIILVLIDEDGAEISDRVTVTVPAGTGIEACGSGFEGSMVAVANVDGVVYSLFEGSEEKANLFKIGSQEFEIPGCYAKDIAVIEESSGSKLIAVVSSSDNILWIGRWNTKSLTMGLTYTTDIAPYKATFAGDSENVIVAGIENAVKLKLISVADGSTVNSLVLPNTNLNSIVALDTVGPFADGGYLGMVVGSDGTWYYLTLFHASGFTNVTSNVGAILLDMITLVLSSDPEIADASFGVDTSAGDAIRFLFTDHHPNFSAFRSIPIIPPGLPPIILSDNASSFALLDLLLPVTSVLPSLNKFPYRFVQSSMGSVPTAYVLTEDNYLWTIENCFDVAVVTQHFDPLSSILPDALVIAIDETGASLAGGNAAGTTTDLSSYIIP